LASKSTSGGSSDAQDQIKKLSTQFKSDLENAQAKYDTLFTEKTKLEAAVDSLKMQINSSSANADSSKKQIGMN
jgi:peptidoglycan hydrolase CwlO-like protein